MTSRNTRSDGFRTDMTPKPGLKARRDGETRQLDTDEGRIWFGSRNPEMPVGEGRATLDRNAEETSENEGMPEHAEKSRDAAKWSRERARRATR